MEIKEYDHPSPTVSPAQKTQNIVINLSFTLTDFDIDS